jgi:hypothetical protein
VATDIANEVCPERTPRLRERYLRRYDIDGQTALDGFREISQQLAHGLALRDAARDGGDFGPETAFLRIMNDDFNFYISSAKRSCKRRIFRVTTNGAGQD